MWRGSWGDFGGKKGKNGQNGTRGSLGQYWGAVRPQNGVKKTPNLGDFGVKNGQFWMKKWIYLGELQFLRIFFEGKSPNLANFVIFIPWVCMG
mgnify:CR=1 FL=1